MNLHQILILSKNEEDAPLHAHNIFPQYAVNTREKIREFLEDHKIEDTFTPDDWQKADEKLTNYILRCRSDGTPEFFLWVDTDEE